MTGCDKDADVGGASATADVRRAGGTVLAGHDPGHVEEARAVVVSSAVPSDHPELVRARQLNVPVVRRAEALAAAIEPGLGVGIAGTHGKTTTTVMTTEALAAAGLNPTGIAGGRVSTWGGNARLGGDNLFVVEADEYDKSFLALSTQVAVINNVEPDHLECYGTVENLEDAFSRFAHPARRVIVGSSPAALRVARLAGRPTWTVGLGQADVAVRVVERSASASVAMVSLPTGRSVELRLKVPGIHNLTNAAAALAVAVELEADLDPVLGALEAFTGVGRRFEHVGDAAGVTVIDDYAHHETEIAATLEAARQAFPGRRLIAAFQPHLFSRTAEHGAEMGKALAAADVVVITDIYPAREAPMPGVTSAIVVDSARAAGASVQWVPDRRELAAALKKLIRRGDAVVTMGAGDITWVGRELVGLLS